MQRSIWVTTQQAGFHRWLQAPENRLYLRNLHRHLFKCRFEMQTLHSNREVEFHNLLDWVNGALHHALEQATQHGYSASCEAIAETILQLATTKWGAFRNYTITISEDGECGATLYWDSSCR